MRFRKTIKIAPGLKLNLSKSGVSTTIGKRGLSATVNKDGAYLNTGVPGTGLSHREKIGGGSDSAPNYEPEIESTPKSDNANETAADVKPEIIKDIPTFKRGLHSSYIIAVICILLGIVSIATVILPILFFIGAVIFLLAANTAKKQIKELESAEVK